MGVIVHHLLRPRKKLSETPINKIYRNYNNRVPTNRILGCTLMHGFCVLANLFYRGRDLAHASLDIACFGDCCATVYIHM
jgi:dolichol kinase